MARSRRASPGPFFRLGGGGGASCVGSTPSRNGPPSPRPHRAKFIFTPRHAGSLKRLGQFKEARSLLRKTLPVARRVLGDTHEYVLRTRSLHAEAFYLSLIHI